MEVSVDAAKADLLMLIEAARNGEDVVITQAAVPVAKLVSVSPKSMSPKRKFKAGIWKDRDLGQGPDFFEPMSEEDLVLWEGGSRRPTSSTLTFGHG